MLLFFGKVVFIFIMISISIAYDFLQTLNTFKLLFIRG